MEAIYGSIRYHLPLKSAEYYAKQALKILAELEERAPLTVPTFLSANSVLTLSGVRAYDAYHEFHDYIDEQNREAASRVLESHDLHIQYTNQLFSLDKSQAYWSSFELLNGKTFRTLWDMYEFPQAARIREEISLEFPYDALHTVAWIGIMEDDIATIMSDSILPRAWLNDWSAPQNLRFGMMLGYPAKAIESILWDSIGLQHEESCDATIAHHDAYFAAWPVYSFTKSLEKDPEILAHEDLWSQILDQVYDSPWHAEIQKSERFQDALRSLEKSEEQ